MTIKFIPSPGASRGRYRLATTETGPGTRPGTWLLACIASCLLATPAIAQDAPRSIQFGFGGENPIDVKAEKATYNGGLTVLEENVVVKQGDTTVYADKMDIYRDATDANSISGSLKLGALRRIEAVGNFKFVNPDNTVTGDEGTYFADREVFIVTGNVVLTQPNGSSVSGDRLVYNLETGTARFGTPCETGTPGANNCGRVRIRIE